MRFEDRVYDKYKKQDQQFKELHMTNKQPKRGWWEF